MMAEELAKIDTEVKVTEPKPPAGGRLSFEDIMGVRKPFVEKKGAIREEIKATEGEILAGQQVQKETAAAGKMAVEEQAAAEVGGAQQRFQQKMQEEPLPAFVPSQDNFKDIAGLFSLIGVVGMVAGKSSGLAAMNAMNGMLEGYRAGRNDLYKRERDVFDKNFKTMLQKHGEFRKEMDDAIKLAQTNRQAGLQAAELAAVRAGSEIVKAQVRRGDLMAAYDTVKDGEAAATKALEMVQANINAEIAARERARQAAQAQAQRNVQLVQTPQGLRTIDVGAVPRATAEEMAKATPFKGGGQQTRQGQNALTFASRVFGNVQNAANDFVNIVLLPATVETPVFSGLLNTERRTALGSLQSLAARKITPKENRAFQQVSDQLGSALAGMEAQGLASGVTKAKIDAFNSLRPGPGDNAINMALYIARVKQEIETGISVHQEMPGATEGQKEKTQAILAKINQVVPFDVNDVLQVMRMKKQTLGANMQQLVKQKPLASNLQFEGVSASGEVEDSTNRYSDPEKESRYQEWLARQPK
jgi:hypothetical protein